MYEEVHPVLLRKVLAVLSDIRCRLPDGWELDIYETYRSPQRQLKLYRSGVSKVKFGKHNLKPCEAVDIVFKYNGSWTWNAPILFGKPGWTVVENCKALHNLRIISWDKPHCELKAEDK